MANVETLGTLERRVSVAVAADEVERKVDERLKQRVRLHDGGVLGAAVVEGVDTLFEPLLVRVHTQVEAVLFAELVSELDHAPELPGRVDVQEREGQLAAMEGLLRQVHHHRRVFSDRVEHHGTLELGGDFAQDVDALGFELSEVAEVQVEGLLGIRWGGHRAGI